MNLPLCVRVEAKDKDSVESLKIDKWKLIGRLLTYTGIMHKGDLVSDARFAVSEEDKKYAWKLSSEIQWSSRLFRDGRQALGYRANDKRISIAHQYGRLVVCDGGFLCINPLENGFAIDLIGVTEKARGSGKAKRMIRFARNAIDKVGPMWVKAGTYDDNNSARVLYQNLGMKVFQEHFIFHKEPA